MGILKNDWKNYLEEEFNKDYYRRIRRFLIQEYRSKTIYPDMYDIFNALHFTPYKDVKVVILGQDPYHGPNQAHGLSFSVKPEVKIPPSLVNIYSCLLYTSLSHCDGRILKYSFVKVFQTASILIVSG